MDEDQSARRVAQKYLKVVDSDYYEFETHIFFDDAFEISDVCDDWMQVRILDYLFGHMKEIVLVLITFNDSKSCFTSNI